MIDQSFFNSLEYKELVREILRNRVAAVVGAGVSQAVGVKGWHDVLEHLRLVLRRIMGYGPKDSQALRELNAYRLVAMCRHSMGEAEFERELNIALSIPHPADLSLHESILQIPFHVIISTNWDNLFLEASHAMAHRVHPVPNHPIVTVTSDAKLKWCMEGRRPILIQPHGALPGDVVTDETAIFSLRERSAGMSAFLQSLFFTHRLILIGYSFSDPDFQRYYHSYVYQLGRQFTTSSSRHFFLSVGHPTSLIHSYASLGLEVITLPLRVADSQKARTDALRDFLLRLQSDTSRHIGRQQRSKRIAGFLTDSLATREILRVRAGLSPLGLPSEVGDQSKDLMAKGFRARLGECERAKLIVSTDFETMQLRIADTVPEARRLRALLEFFKSDDPETQRILNRLWVVDRQGPYEIQQYIVGKRVMAESRKLRFQDRDYHDARIIMAEDEVAEAVEVFDSCFESLALSNLSQLLRASDSVGKEYLINSIVKAGRSREILKSADRIEARAKEFAPRPEDQTYFVEWSRDLAQQLGAVKKEQLQNQDAEAIRDRIEAIVLTSQPRLLMAVLDESLVYRSILKHLVQIWEDNIKMLEEQRRHHWLIEINDKEGKARGYLDKSKYHMALPTNEDYSGGACEDLLWNLHASALGILGNGKSVVLRRRLIDTDHFDERKWDRTVTGHVRRLGNYDQEFQDELLHHYFSSLENPRLRFVGIEEFIGLCQDRHSNIWEALEEIPAVRLGSPKPTVLHRECSNGRIIMEPVLSMVYLFLLPTVDLPNRRDDKHYTGWLSLNADQLRSLIDSARGEAKVNPDSILLLGENGVEGPGSTTISVSDLTQEVLIIMKTFAKELSRAIS